MQTDLVVEEIRDLNKDLVIQDDDNEGKEFSASTETEADNKAKIFNSIFLTERERGSFYTVRRSSAMADVSILIHPPLKPSGNYIGAHEYLDLIALLSCREIV